MNLLAKPAMAIQFFWTLLALCGALIVLAITLGVAAWNGVNVPVALYLAFSGLATVGLLLGVALSFSTQPIFSWTTAISASVIGCLSVIYILGLLSNHLRERASLTVSDMRLGGLHGPAINFYAFALLTCSFQVLISILKIRQLKLLR
ncbi:MAG: hypothetical protein ABI286_09495 [Edaphobacter sp.]